MSWEKEVEAIAARRARVLEQGGAEALERQRAKGRLPLRERIDLLLDPGSFREQGPIAGARELDEEGNETGFTPANFLLGFGAVDGRRIIVGGEDFTVRGGSPTPAGLRKSVYTEEMAVRYRVPLVRLHEGGGGSVAGAAGGRAASGPVGSPVFERPRFRSVAEAMATVPVASAALGPVAGLPAARLVASHFTVMTRETAQVLIAGPAVVQRALNQEATKESLGGADVHLKNGVIDNVADDEAGALAQIRRFLSYMPDNVDGLPPVSACEDDRERREEMLLSVVPKDRRKPYDMRKVMRAIFDIDSLFEVSRKWGPGIITAYARLNGHPVGVIANDCRFYAGAMSADGARKFRRFVEICETFHLPVVCLVDEPGFMIGEQSEREGAIRPGTAAVLAAASCSVPWASVIVKKVYGVAGAAHFGDGAHVLAWPSAESGALPVEGGVAVAFGREIAAAPDPEARRRELEEQLAERQSPMPRAESFAYHDIIDPRETRPALCDWIDWSWPLLETLRGPRRFPILP